MSQVTDPELAHLPTPLALILERGSSLTGLASDQFRLLCCLLLSVLLGQVHRRLPNVTVKHIFSFTWGLAFCYVLVGWTMLHLVATVLVTLVILKTVHYHRAPMLVFLWSLFHLSYAHIYRMITSYLGYNLDISLLQMITCVKCITFAYNYADGQALKNGEPLSTFPKLASLREERCVRAMPTIIETFSYFFFYAGVLVGPCYELREYLDFTSGELFKRDGYSVRGPPGSLKAALKSLGKGLLLYIGMFISGFLPLQGYIQSDAFMNQTSFAYRYAYSMVAIITGRAKYYFAWYFAEGGCNSAGLGYSGQVRDKDGHVIAVKWERCINAHAWAVESANGLHTVTNHWNLGVNNWLKHYVFFRLEPHHNFLRCVGVPNSVFGNYVTKFTSAIWHGYYTGYFLFFLSGALATQFDAAWHKVFDPVAPSATASASERSSYKRKYIIWRIVGWFVCMSILNYLGMAFMLLDGMSAITYWSNMYWWGHIACIVGLISLHFAAPKKTKKDAHTHGGHKKEKEGATVAALGANPNATAATATVANGTTKKDE